MEEAALVSCKGCLVSYGHSSVDYASSCSVSSEEYAVSDPAYGGGDVAE